MTTYGDCTFCCATVEEKRIEYDYRRKGNLLIVSNVPAGVCRQCGESYFTPEVLKKMDQLYHDIFDRHQKPERVISVPAVSL
ncbi:MAG: type II toxin-antitoxin system MqsA family antitoxin [SAR202 cluster bacterium]|nr:type II toxin-antitoxin system MqsA family antitoxin [SAR202 cluster bacterium]